MFASLFKHALALVGCCATLLPLTAALAPASPSPSMVTLSQPDTLRDERRTAPSTVASTRSTTTNAPSTRAALPSVAGPNPSPATSAHCVSPLSLCQVLQATSRPDSAALHALWLDVSAMAFFKDNEFDGNISKGYTLPGFWLQPRLSYKPLPELNFELGFHALVFDGANKYPNYAFHDIARWKGSQYQEGAHLLPHFRAEAQLGAVRLVLGNLYGGVAHQLITPLYNPELAISADPEHGLQLLLRRPRYQLDTWVDWESFIFDHVTHQEAFTLGVAQRIGLSAPQHSFSLTLPIQFVAQHRGGEQDDTDMGVQTLLNASVGLVARRQYPHRPISALEAEAHFLTAYQQAGQLWPFQEGTALWAAAAMEIGTHLRLRVGYFAARNFSSIHGSPFFGTLSLKETDGRFSHMNTATWSVEYSRHFGQGYSFGAMAEGYVTENGRLQLPDGSVQAARWGNAFSFGVFLRANPSFLLRRFAH